VRGCQRWESLTVLAEGARKRPVLQWGERGCGNGSWVMGRGKTEFSCCGKCRSLLDAPLWIVDGSLCDPWMIVPREVTVCDTTSSARDDLRV